MTAPGQRTPPADVKACCAATYSSDLVALLLGESYHPGGLALTRRLCRLIRLSPGASLLDVAAGRGTTALMLAGEYDVTVDGVDLSAANTTRATERAASTGLADKTQFHAGDAERLPFADATFDAVVCECAFCTFPDKTAAASELSRVLRPGGSLGLTDVVADQDRLPPELTSLTSWVACIADARPAAAYAELLAGAGLTVTLLERHDTAIVRMIDEIAARIDVLRMTSRAEAEALGLDFGQAQPLLGAARAAVADGTIGYTLLVAEKPG